MKTDQPPVVFYKDARFWLVIAFSMVLATFLLVINPA
jgi:hypothetical protein